jgi:hypothetical protein
MVPRLNAPFKGRFFFIFKEDFMYTQKRIKMKYFMEKYLGMTKEEGKISHKELKEFNIHGLKCVPFDLIESNPELVVTGAVLLVEDDYRNSAPYKNPQIELANIYGFQPIYEDYEIDEEIPQKGLRRRK